MLDKNRIYQIIFNHDTKAGRTFDIVLLWAILFSVLVVIIESVPYFKLNFYNLFRTVELFLTALFTIEYVLRIWSSPDRKKYLLSFWGIIDLLAILPTYLELFFIDSHYLVTIRIFRLLRIFRILKLSNFSRAANVLIVTLLNSSYRISVFFFVVIFIVTILGTLMYIVEGGKGDFDSIPHSIYWAIVTITTVGFGDIVPTTVAGKFLASFVMLLGYAIIAIPTGIVTAEMTMSRSGKISCPKCSLKQSKENKFCSECGTELSSKENLDKTKFD